MRGKTFLGAVSVDRGQNAFLLGGFFIRVGGLEARQQELVLKALFVEPCTRVQRVSSAFGLSFKNRALLYRQGDEAAAACLVLDDLVPGGLSGFLVDLVPDNGPELLEEVRRELRFGLPGFPRFRNRRNRNRIRNRRLRCVLFFLFFLFSLFSLLFVAA